MNARVDHRYVDNLDQVGRLVDSSYVEEYFAVLDSVRLLPAVSTFLLPSLRHDHQPMSCVN
jgi:hypothetical protein